MEAARSVSEVLALQQILQSENVLDLFGGFSDADLGEEEFDIGPSNNSREDDCDSEKNKNITLQYFCGNLRDDYSGFFKNVINRSCYGDSYKRGR